MTINRSFQAMAAAAGVALALLTAAGAAQARSDVSWSVGIGVPGVVVGQQWRLLRPGAGVCGTAPGVLCAPPGVLRPAAARGLRPATTCLLLRWRLPGGPGFIGVIAIATTAIIVVTTAIEPGIDHRGGAVCHCPGGVFRPARQPSGCLVLCAPHNLAFWPAGGAVRQAQCLECPRENRLRPQWPQPGPAGHA